MNTSSITVNDTEIPSLGLGTSNVYGRRCEQVVRYALELGYRHLDTAEYYDNQEAVGNGIARSSVDRDEIFLTTKVWKTNLRRDDVRRSVVESIRTLDTDYVDLLLIHFPNEDVPIEETIGAMNDLQTDGLVRNIGVSNFSITQTRAAVNASETPVLVDQVKYNPLTDRTDLHEFCLENDIALVAHSPLAKGRVIGNETLDEIGDTYDKSGVQVALRWLVQQEMVAAIPKASSRAHIEANIDIFDFELTPAEMERIFDLRGRLLPRILNRFNVARILH